MLYKKRSSENFFQNLKGKRLSRSRLLNKGAGLRPAISGFDSNYKITVRNRVRVPKFWCT